MPRYASASLALLMVALAAAPALAVVDDPLELLGPGVAKALATELSNLHADDLDVVVVKHAPAGAPVEALTAYGRSKPLPESGLILVAIEDQQAGVALGPAYVERAVTNEKADELARAVMPEFFRSGVPSNGVIELARRIKQAKALGPRPGYVPPPPPMRTPWELLILGGLAVVGGGTWAVVSRRRKRAQALLEERVRGERGRLAKLRDDLRALEDRLGDAAITGPEAHALREAALAELPALDAGQAPLREALRGLSERLEGGRAAGVEAELRPMARQGLLLALRLHALGPAVAPLFAEAREIRARLGEATQLQAAWLAGEPGAEPRGRVADGLEAAAARLDAEDRVGALARLADACRAMAPVDPDEAWLARTADPAAGPALAREVVDRLAALGAALEAAERRDGEAGRAGREGLRGRLDALESMLGGPRPDLGKASQLLDATERLEQARGGAR